VLESLAGAFADHLNNVADLRRDTSSQDFLDHVEWESRRFQRGLYGAAFVSCQPFITAVVENALRLRAHMTGNLALESKSLRLPADEWDIRSVGFSGQGVSDVLLIHYVANYFKHHEEWPEDIWDQPPNGGAAGYTIAYLKARGFEKMHDGLLEEAATQLVARGVQITQLGYIIERWARDLYNTAEMDLERKRSRG